MATMLDNDFTSWEFTEDELPVARTFSDLQIKHLQNELSMIMQRKMAIVVEPSDTAMAIYRHEYYRGQADIIRFLLGLSNEASEDLVELMRRQAADQEDDSL